MLSDDGAPVDRREQGAPGALLGIGRMDAERIDDVVGVERSHLDHALEATRIRKGLAQRARMARRAHHQRVLGGDRTVDDVEQEIHHRTHRQIGPAAAELPGSRNSSS